MAERIEGKSDAQANVPADAVAEELLRLLALADESAGLDLLRVAAGLHHPARGALRPLAPAAGEAPAAVAVVVVPTPTHGNESNWRIESDLGLGCSRSAAVYFWTRIWALLVLGSNPVCGSRRGLGGSRRMWKAPCLSVPRVYLTGRRLSI